MANDDLKKLSRPALLQLLLEAEEENEKLKQQVAELSARLEDRNIRVEKCGDLASASLELNGVFSAAQAACQQYIENMKNRSASVEEICRRMERESSERCRDMEQKAAARCRQKEEETSAKCNAILQELREKYDRYWGALSEQVDRSIRTDGEIEKG